MFEEPKNLESFSLSRELRKLKVMMYLKKNQIRHLVFDDSLKSCSYDYFVSTDILAKCASKKSKFDFLPTWERAPGWLRMVPRGCRKGLPAEAQAPEERLQGPWAPEIPSRA